MPLLSGLQENSSCRPLRPSSACPLRSFPARAAKTSRQSRASPLSVRASPPAKARSATMPSTTPKAVPGAVIRSLHPSQETRSLVRPARRHRASCGSNQSCAAEKLCRSSFRLNEKSSSILPALLQLHLKSKWQYGRERHHTNTIRARNTTGASGRMNSASTCRHAPQGGLAPPFRFARHRFNPNLRPEFRYRSHQRGPLGTNREPVTDILDVRPVTVAPFVSSRLRRP